MLDRDAGHGRSESRSIKVIDLDGTAEAGLFAHGVRAIKVVRAHGGGHHVTIVRCGLRSIPR
jgi:hypothetical protein